jgi:hypothetical protein
MDAEGLTARATPIEHPADSDQIELLGVLSSIRSSKNAPGDPDVETVLDTLKSWKAVEDSGVRVRQYEEYPSIEQWKVDSVWSSIPGSSAHEQQRCQTCFIILFY